MSNKAKVFRDPVHDIISYEREGDFGRLMVSLIDTPEFQRLRFVRQLGLASLVFHGAEHSRFAHSMGVAHLARRIFDQLHPDTPHDDPVRVATIAAALLHDIGHGPFSHAMERVFGMSHESYSYALIADPSTRLHQVLSFYDPDLPLRVAGYFESATHHYTKAIVSSQMDADRFDYLSRDSLMTGVEVGRYDLERILLMLGHDEHGLLADVRAYEAIEGYLIARYHMYRLVYFHKAVRAAEVMLQLMFERAKDLMNKGVAVISADSLLGRLMCGERLPAADYCQLSEIDSWAQIRSWSRHPDPILADLAGSLFERRLFRSLEQTIESPDHQREIERLEELVRERLTPEQRYLFVVDVAQDQPYKPYWPGQTLVGGAIRIRDRQGTLFAIEQRSPIVETLARASYRLRRWCFHRQLEPLVHQVLPAGPPKTGTPIH
ncbi:MAG: HD domain-containing protein [Bradymonadales bacterium]|nr:HD domain-containing protein [Bradymonadales bacterium]